MRDPKRALDVLKRHAPPLLLLLGAASTQATELVYYPVNPNFGGSPLNGATLLSQAQAQNRTKDPDMDKGKLSPLDQLKESLQRAVVGRLAAAATAGVIGQNGLQEGTADIAGLFITVTKNPDGSYKLYAIDKDSGQILEVDL